MMKIIIKWIIAHTTNKAVWRVTYNDIPDRPTRLLSWHQAKSCARIWPGKLFIDYDKGYF